MGTPKSDRLFCLEGPTFKILCSFLLMEMEASENPSCGLLCCGVGWGGLEWDVNREGHAFFTIQKCTST